MLVNDLCQRDFRVIVVDDGSTDDTPQIASLAGASVNFNPQRIGIGPSLMTGWALALKAGAKRIVQIDAGGSHDPKAARTMVQALDVADMVIGSRFAPSAKYVGGPWQRPILSKIAATMCNLAQHGGRYSDWTSGYRAFTREALERLIEKNYTARMHSWQIEVLANAGALGLSIMEIPIVYTAGRSSFNRKVANEAINSWLHVFNHIGAVGSEA